MTVDSWNHLYGPLIIGAMGIVAITHSKGAAASMRTYAMWLRKTSGLNYPTSDAPYVWAVRVGALIAIVAAIRGLLWRR